MEKVHSWCGQPSDRGSLRNRTEQNRVVASSAGEINYSAGIPTLLLDWPTHPRPWGIYYSAIVAGATMTEVTEAMK